jgi:hypothetical protein
MQKITNNVFDYATLELQPLQGVESEVKPHMQDYRAKQR